MLGPFGILGLGSRPGAVAHEGAPPSGLRGPSCGALRSGPPRFGCRRGCQDQRGGGGSANTNVHGDAWRPEHVQLVGIELAKQSARGHRCLIGQQVHVRLEMLGEELAANVRAHLAGASLEPNG